MYSHEDENPRRGLPCEAATNGKWSMCDYQVVTVYLKGVGTREIL